MHGGPEGKGDLLAPLLRVTHGAELILGDVVVREVVAQVGQGAVLRRHLVVRVGSGFVVRFGRVASFL